MVNSHFEFMRVDNFLDDINREDCFDTQDMDGITPNFRFVLASDCPNDITDCIDQEGTLNLDNVTLLETQGVDDGYCSLLWGKGINGERTMSISNSTLNYDLGEDYVHIKAIFLVSIANGTGYVLAYCILDKTLEEDGQLILPTDGMVWSIRYGN